MKGHHTMSFSKRLYEQQTATDAPEARLASVNRLVARAYTAACDDAPDYETLDTIARALHEARRELNALATSIGTLESLTY
jgi:transcription initiation factor TFIIIB Brf1 subunit/transcription initiation factor TFIIB